MKSLLPFLALAAATPAAAQVASLPDRPIRRAEIVTVVQRQFAAMDANRDKSVSRAEFDRYRATQPPADQSSGAAALTRVGGKWFDRADADADGRVTLAEAQARPLNFFKLADRDGDGIVTVTERNVAIAMMALGGG